MRLACKIPLYLCRPLIDPPLLPRFLLAALQIDRIFVARTIKEIKLALKSMPRELNELYEQTLKRIQTQAGNDGALGMRILSWIAHAKRPLSVEELRHGLAVEYDDDAGELDELDKDNLLSQESLVDVCAGLVVIDSTSRIIRLVHYTTQEYFDKERLHLFNDAEVDISRACLAYLSYNYGTDFTTRELRTKVLQSHPFLEYATVHWFLHVESCLLADNPDPDFLEVVANFKSSDMISISSDLLRKLSNIMRIEFLDRFELDRKSKVFPLQVAASEGLKELVIVILDHSTGSCPGLDNALTLASYRGHLNVVKLLLQYGAQVDSIVTTGYGISTTALAEACRGGHLSVAKFLVENGADIHGGALAYWPPLHCAAGYGHPTLVDFLLKEGVNPNARGPSGQTACHGAQLCCGVDSIKRLLDAHYDLELRDDEGETVLHWAVNASTPLDVEGIGLLLDRGADALAKDKRGRTARSILENRMRDWERRNCTEYVKVFHPLVQRLLRLEELSSASTTNKPTSEAGNG